MAEQQAEQAEQAEQATSPREVMLADLRQRAAWRLESAAEYGRRGDESTVSYFYGQADAFLSAAYILEHYHQGVGA